MRSTGNAIYRHSLVTRITHAIFFLAFSGLAFSGTVLYFHKHWIPHAGTVHQILALLMLASAAVYFAGAMMSGHMTDVLFGAGDARGLIPMAAYYLRLRRDAPEYNGYNPLQKLAYTAVLLMIGPLLAATGLAIWPHMPIFRPLAALFGGKAARIWHIGFAIELVLFVIGHAVMVATTGLRNNLRSIVTGWYGVRTPAA